MRKAAVFLGALLLAGSAFAWKSADFYLKNGDRVVFYGDSITDQRLYTTLTETYVVTRYPKLDVSFVHSGWGGDKVSGGGGGPIALRLQRDVFPYKPTVMTIMLGMNDGRYRAATAANDQEFFDGFKNIVESTKQNLPGIRITAIRPSPYDDFTREPNFAGGYNAVLINFGNWIAHYAQENGLNVADLNTNVVATLKKAEEIDPQLATKILPDRVHPGVGGHLIMAEELIKSWNGRALVSAVTIDASGSRPKVKLQDHTEVTGLTSENGVQWTELDDALPLPFANWEKDQAVALAVRSSDVTEALNQEPLTVRGLKEGNYTLKIDGETVGTFSNTDLAKGVNLAVLATPMAKQAFEVHDLTLKHNNVHFAKWRTVQVPLQDSNVAQGKAAMDALDALDAALVAKQHEAAQPKSHHFELVPAA